MATAEHRSKLKAKRTLSGFLADDNGSYAIEFAMVAAPFIALILAIMELGLVFFAGTHLDKAVDGAARTIRTGIAQNEGFTIDDFQQKILDESAGALFSADKLQIDVRTAATFSSIDPAIPIDGDGEVDDDDFGFNPGTCSEVVLVRVYYSWPVMTPKFGAQNLGLDLSGPTSGIHILSSVKAFQNEPFC